MSIRGKILVLVATILIILIINSSEALPHQQQPENQKLTVPAMFQNRGSFWIG